MNEGKGESGWPVSSVLYKEFYLSHQKSNCCGVCTVPHPWTCLMLYRQFRQVGVPEMWWIKESTLAFPTRTQDLWGCKTTVRSSPCLQSLLPVGEGKKRQKCYSLCSSCILLLSRKNLSTALWLSEAVAAAPKNKLQSLPYVLKKSYETSLCQLFHSNIRQYPEPQEKHSNCP